MREWNHDLTGYEPRPGDWVVVVTPYADDPDPTVMCIGAQGYGGEEPSVCVDSCGCCGTSRTIVAWFRPEVALPEYFPAKIAPAPHPEIGDPIALDDDGVIAATPNLAGGEPCIAGTVVLTASIMDKVVTGYSSGRIVREVYPFLAKDQVNAAVEFERRRRVNSLARSMYEDSLDATIAGMEWLDLPEDARAGWRETALSRRSR